MDNDDHTGPINIGNPTEFTMLELAKVLLPLLPAPPPLSFMLGAWSLLLLSGPVCDCCSVRPWCSDTRQQRQTRRRLASQLAYLCSFSCRCPTRRSFASKERLAAPHAPRTNIDRQPLFMHLQVVQEVVNPDANIEFRENTADDPSRRKPDITRVRSNRASCNGSLWTLLLQLSERRGRGRQSR